MNKDTGLRIRLSNEEKLLLEAKSKEFGFAGVSEYLRFVGKNCIKIQVDIKNDK